MNNPKCKICGCKTKRNGTTSSGRPRFRCTSCGASSIRKIDSAAKDLDTFLKWLFSKNSIAELKMSRTTFWRKFSKFWNLWPIAPFTGEVCDVIFLDGLWLKKEATVLIASAEHILGWHLARQECTQSWLALMSRIPAPTLLVCDGSSGLATAAKIAWPTTKIQRCLFHVSSQIKRYTTRRPILECGQELLGLANQLMRVKETNEAISWIKDYADWSDKWDSFLNEFTYKDGKKIFTHERLRKARSTVDRLLKEKTLFTFIQLKEDTGKDWPSMNNSIESKNARLREMLRLHRGLPLMHRIKAIFWWCYMNTELPAPTAELLRIMPTDDEVDGLYRLAVKKNSREDGTPERYGTGIVWDEFHMPTNYKQ